MGEGSSFQLQIVDQALLKLIPNIGHKTNILEIACGNGFLARRLARRGAKVCMPRLLKRDD
jgi:2-polyprenyl-3-methyl-5-hydroxy-6-metoxy-1,4-benzoquinol methylase